MILVVAPAEGSRRSIASALRRDGHEVIELADATHLLARVLGHPAEKPLILADPRAGVSEVLELLRATAWRGPVLLMDRDARGASRLDQLRATVRRTLAARAAS
jgi:hypothetical protein